MRLFSTLYFQPALTLVMEVRMIRLGISIFLLVCGLSQGQTLQGRVANRLEQPLKGARVCLLGFADRCAVSDDSGRWSLAIPTGIRDRSHAGSDVGFFRIKKGPAFTLESSATSPLRLDWMDASGRPLGSRGIPLPSRLSGSLRLEREFLASLPAGILLLRARLGRIQRTLGFVNLPGGPMGIRTLSTAASAKAGYYLPYYLETSLAGYETAFGTAVEPPDLDWITLTPLGEPRDLRSYSTTLPVLSIDRDRRYVEVRSSFISCDSGKLIERKSDVRMPFRLHEGKLYIPRSGDSCRATRFAGNGADIIGTWILDDAYAEMPAPYQPSGCPTVLPFSRPPDPGATGTYRFSTTELSVESSGPQCLSDDRWFYARNLIMHNDRSVRWVENSCRRTVWVNSAGDSAFQTFRIHGGRDSAEATFTYGGKSCSYVDDGLFSDPPPSCPDPVETARAAYLDCIAASGFADIPGILRKRASAKDGTGKTGWFRMFGAP